MAASGQVPPAQTAALSGWVLPSTRLGRGGRSGGYDNLLVEAGLASADGVPPWQQGLGPTTIMRLCG